MIYKYSSLVFLGLVLILGNLYAQDHAGEEEKISGLFPGIDFSRFVSQIESSTAFRFYFRLSDVDSVQVNVSAKNNTLRQILNGIFEKTDLKFTIDEKNRVFITKNSPLNLTLSNQFFKSYESPDSSDSLQRTSDTERVFSRNKLHVIDTAENSNSGPTATLSGLNDKNNIRLNSYASKDLFRFDADTLFQYENRNINLGWTHYISERFEAEFIVGRDYYSFDIEGRDNVSNAYDYGFRVQQDFIKANFTYEYEERHNLNFGVNSIRYQLRPGYISPSGAESIVIPEAVNQEQALETAFYIGDDFEVPLSFILLN